MSACTCNHPSPSLEVGAPPPGYRAVRRRGRVTGLSRYGGGRLDAKLATLVRAGRLRLTFDDIDLFQRIANVETGGQVQALNTWDSAVVSIGFLQLTLRFGVLQDWINRAPAAFARYGIAVDRGRAYRFGRDSVPAIVGAPDPSALRWDPWADRFYRAGLDDEVIVAQVAIGLERNANNLNQLRRLLGPRAGAYEVFLSHYRRSAYIRGVYQEACNNRPAYARRGAANAAVAAQARGPVTTTEFTARLTAAIRAAFAAHGDGTKADHIIARVRTGARPDLLAPARP